MKKVITILLVLLFIANEFSFITVYLPLRNLATMLQKAKVENCFDSNDFDLIVIKENEKESSAVKFIDDSEILFNGELYDIVSTVRNDDNLYLYCLKDETENLLDKSFKLHFDNLRNNKFSLNFFNITVAKKLIAFVFEDNHGSSISQIDKIVINNININLNPFIDKHSPPPKFS